MNISRMVKVEHHDCCKKLRELLGDYLDGEIEKYCCEEIEQHMQSCAKCEIIVRTTLTSMRICQEHIIREEVPDGIRLRVRRVIKQRLIQEKLIEE